jgi:hypothetical protein
MDVKWILILILKLKILIIKSDVYSSNSNERLIKFDVLTFLINKTIKG